MQDSVLQMTHSTIVTSCATFLRYSLSECVLGSGTEKGLGKRRHRTPMTSDWPGEDSMIEKESGNGHFKGGRVLRETRGGRTELRKRTEKQTREPRQNRQLRRPFQH